MWHFIEFALQFLVCHCSVTPGFVENPIIDSRSVLKTIYSIYSILVS
jgi:hypothetical protein